MWISRTRCRPYCLASILCMPTLHTLDDWTWLNVFAGVGMLLMGVASVLAMKRDAPSLKTFSLAAAVLVGLLSWSFVTQVCPLDTPRPVVNVAGLSVQASLWCMRDHRISDRVDHMLRASHICLTKLPDRAWSFLALLRPWGHLCVRCNRCDHRGAATGVGIRVANAQDN